MGESLFLKLFHSIFFAYFAWIVEEGSFQGWSTNVVCGQKEEYVSRDFWTKSLGSGWWGKGGTGNSAWSWDRARRPEGSPKLLLTFSRNWIPSKFRLLFKILTEINKIIHWQKICFLLLYLMYILKTILSVHPHPTFGFIAYVLFERKWTVKTLLRRECYC